MENAENTSEVLAKNHPEVRFGINEDAEVRKFADFLAENKSKGGTNLTKVLLKNHPGLGGVTNLTPEKRLETIKLYINDYYRTKKENLSEANQAIKTGWDEYAPQFFQITDKLFKGMKWPEGEYVGNLSISPPFPRYLDSKTFQFPCDSVNKGIRVSAHEMLHFLFYEYVRQRYAPDLPNTDEREMIKRLNGKLEIPLWELSEIFNIVVLSKTEFGKGSKKLPNTSYADLQTQYGKRFAQLWEESDQDIDTLFTKLEID